MLPFLNSDKSSSWFHTTHLAQDQTGPTIDQWHERALQRLLRAILRLGVIAAIPISTLAVMQGAWFVPLADTVALGLVWLLYRQRHWTYRVRANTLMALMYGFSVWLFFSSGTSGLLFLLACPVMAALLLGSRAAAASVVVCSATALVVGYTADHLYPMSTLKAQFDVMRVWLVTLNFCFVGSVVAYTTHLMLSGLGGALEREQQVTQHLRKERERLAAANAARKVAQTQLYQMGYYDTLTGLPNRRLLMEHIETAQTDIPHQHSAAALVYLDLDDFRTLNEARGSSSGDALLCQVAHVLRTLADAGTTVARVGGDEFALLLAGLPTEEHQLIKATTARVESIQQRLHIPLELEGESFHASVSLGVTVFSDQSRAAEDLIQEAEIAMYRAKKGGRSSLAFFAPAMQSEVQLRLNQERDLEAALAQGQFKMFAQSQLWADGRLAGAELLIRWQHPTCGMVSPAEFVPLAEDNGLIVPMGLWALGQGCSALAQLQQAGLKLNLSVNVSVRQFGQDGFVNDVQTILAASGADPSCLVLEVTESLLIQQPEVVVARMHELARLGVRFSIDDFGTGYSSLAYLQRLPLYELKIDRGFVRDAPRQAGDAAITRLIISMAKHLGLKVVAEGVETPEQSRFLADNGCDVMQGFLYARPMPLDAWVAQTCGTACQASL